MEKSLLLILEDYGVADGSKLSVDRVENLDRDGALAYRAGISGEKKSIIVLAETGYDGYVAKVTDAYVKNG